jgi:hypothetical protein
MNDLESMPIAILLVAGVVAVVTIVLVFLLSLAPAPIREPVRSAFLRWNEKTMGLLERGAHPWAVIMVGDFRAYLDRRDRLHVRAPLTSASRSATASVRRNVASARSGKSVHRFAVSVRSCESSELTAL